MASARILIVEDEFIIAELMQLSLETSDYGECLHVSKVSEALAAVTTWSPSAAFLDIRLNGELVFPVADRLKRLGVPFAFSSGMGEASVIPADFKGAPILSKPWSDAELSRVADLLVAKK